MKRHPSPWVIVLAAGSGTRLAALTVGPDGVVVPKQFCSLRGGRSLLLDTLDRALRLAPRDRVLVVVSAAHERWWRPQLACMPPANVLVQPANRGTTAGVLLPLAHLLDRDPAADVAVLPSDHFVAAPHVLADAMRKALACVAAEPSAPVLLGITPDAADPEYGWITPGAREGALRTVVSFVEKPPRATAELLLHTGAVWNSFLFAANAAALWRLCARREPTIAAGIAAAVLGPTADRDRALATAYADLPASDFSAAVLGRSAPELRLLHVPPCGWTDLGTQARVADCLQRLGRGGHTPHRPMWFPTVDLAHAAGAPPAAAIA